ncbi:MAG: hypothetical protein RL264_855 [Bacteroidota bacterium]|jgi:UDP-N-acetylmuramate dehydrogenase
MIEYNVSLLPFNTFQIDVKATGFARFSSVSILSNLLKTCSIRPLLIIGGGSNLLFTKDVDAFVLKNEITGITILKEDEKNVIVEVGGGEVWHEFVCWTIEHGFGGLENLSLIPGSVGASPMQNIGAYGVEIKDVFEHLYAFNLATNEEEKFDASACRFGYRDSVFKQELKNKYVITRVAFRLTKQPIVNTKYGAISDELAKKGITEPTIKDVSEAVIAIRQSKLPDPKVLGNAGSFFKNPVVSVTLAEKVKEEFPNAPIYPVNENEAKIAAGWLIEQTGWKGKKIGFCGVHTLQALVLVNYGGSTGNEVFSMSQSIIDAVKEKFGVELEREVNIW